MIKLVQINFSEDHSQKILPLGIFSVASALKKQGFQDIEIINITEKEIEETAQKIVVENPECVGMSVMTGVQTGHSAQLCKKIKELTNIPIIWGGIHPSLLPEQCLRETYIDFVVVGEGEETMFELLQEMNGCRRFENIAGLGYKRNAEIFINAPRPQIKNLDEWRLDWKLLNPEDYIYKLGKYQRVIAYKASRGCPFNCAFCYNNAFNLNRWRTWSIGAVVEDIDYLKKEFDVQAINFYDDNFFVNRQRAWQLLDEIALPAHVEIRIDSIDDESARRLHEHECYKCLIGVESGSDRILDLIGKGYHVPRIYEAVKNLAKYNVSACYSTIVGLPTETEEESQSTIKLLHDIYRIHPQADFTLGAYLPYPGSRMYNFAIENGFVPPKNTEDWQFIDRFRKDYESPWVDAKKVWKIREYFKFLGWKLGPLNKWFEFRIKKQFFNFTWDIQVIEYLSGIVIEERGWLGKVLRKLYRTLKYSQPK